MALSYRPALVAVTVAAGATRQCRILESTEFQPLNANTARGSTTLCCYVTEKALALRLRKAAPSSKLGAPGNSYPTYGTLLVLLVLAEYDYGP
eukprot:3936830-Rhodomonas_salina.1